MSPSFDEPCYRDVTTAKAPSGTDTLQMGGEKWGIDVAGREENCWSRGIGTKVTKLTTRNDDRVIGAKSLDSIVDDFRAQEIAAEGTKKVGDQNIH